MEGTLQDKLLMWIGQEVEARSSDERPGAVPVHMLQVKMAVAAKESNDDLTQSTEIALQIFDRSEMYRALREMVTRDEIAFVDEWGNEKTIDDNVINRHASGNASGQIYVSLTEAGLPKYRSLVSQIKK